MGAMTQDYCPKPWPPRLLDDLASLKKKLSRSVLIPVLLTLAILGAVAALEITLHGWAHDPVQQATTNGFLIRALP